MRLLPTSGSSESTGLPIEVADEDARLALTPVSGSRVKQLSDGMVWAYEGAVWYPAPGLTDDLSPENVASPYSYRSRDNPFSATGTFVPLTTPSSILPQQKWADYIEEFVGVGHDGSPFISIYDTNVTYIDPSLVLRLYAAQQVVSSTCSISLQCGLEASCVDGILAALASYGGVVTSGSINLTGASFPPTKQDAFSLPAGTTWNFEGVYTRYATDFTGRGEYNGLATEYPNHTFTILYNVASTRWEITDSNTATLIAYSENNNTDQFPWETAYTDGTSTYNATQLENVDKLALIALGLSVTTN